jgi:hypothetical protein
MHTAIIRQQAETDVQVSLLVVSHTATRAAIGGKPRLAFGTMVILSADAAQTGFASA